MIYSKQALFDLINEFPDDEEFAGVSFWVRSDVENGGKPLTDEQWRKFAEWLYENQDLSWDFDDAKSHALSNEKADN